MRLENSLRSLSKPQAATAPSPCPAAAAVPQGYLCAPQPPSALTIGFVAVHGLDCEQEVLVLQVLDISQNGVELGAERPSEE